MRCRNAGKRFANKVIPTSAKVINEAIGSTSAENKAYSNGAFRESAYNVTTLARQNSRVYRCGRIVARIVLSYNGKKVIVRY